LSRVSTPGLAVYCLIAGLGLFIDRGLTGPWLIPWIAGFLFLIFRLSYEAYIAPPPFRPFPFVVLGVILLNFLIQVSGGVHSVLWPAYFVYAVVIAAFQPPPRTYAMVAIILAIESANLYRSAGSLDLSDRWHVYAGFGISLVSVSAAASHIMQRTRREAEQARDAHERLLAHAEAVDPLAAPARLESLAPARRQAAHLRTVIDREIDFNGLIDMIYGFVPAHTYALFLREPRDGDTFALGAVRAERPQDVLPVGTALDPGRRILIDICAEQRQTQYLSDLAAMSMPLVNLGYYRSSVQDLPVRSFLVLPIIKDDRTIAVLAVDSLEAGAFNLDMQDMLEKFAPFFLQIIDKIDLTLELKTQADHFGYLHEISTELNRSLLFGDTMRSIIPQLRGIVPFDLCACVLVDDREGRQTLTPAALYGYDESLLGRSFSLDERTLVYSMWKHWESQHEHASLTYYSADFGDRGRDISILPFKEFQKPIRSLYGRLLVAKTKDQPESDAYILRGAVFLASLRPNAFTQYHRDHLLDTLMNQISQVAHNSLLYQQIENMARTDGLTGLLNHRTFMEKLREKYRELDRASRPFSILLMDIDKFKSVNDKYGHPVGDEAIKAVARVLTGIIRGSDFVARYGGEEFAVGMIDTDRKGAEQMAERVRREMEQTDITRVFDGVLKVTLSIGVVTFPDDSEDKANLVTLADEALYHAKRSGRNRVSRYRDARQEPAAAP
jgi:diguanylate cyclase (GGDEF)-like protein